MVSCIILISYYKLDNSDKIAGRAGIENQSLSFEHLPDCELVVGILHYTCSFFVGCRDRLLIKTYSVFAEK